MTPSAASFTSVPVNHFFGFRLGSHDPAGATVSFRPERMHTQEYGVVHGGIVSALADTAAVYTVHPFLEAGARMTSIEFKVNFLAGATPEQGDLVARAQVKRKGRTIAVIQVDVSQGEALIATGLFTYIILREKPA